MKFDIEVSAVFEKQSERLYKKYPSIFSDIKKLIGGLQTNPIQGGSLGNGLYKIRMKITSKGQGKSGGARVITCVKIIETKVVMAAIYDKSEQETMTAKQLFDLLNKI